MQLEPFDINDDPLVRLMREECETVSDEMEVDALSDQRETLLLAARHITRVLNPE